MIQPSWRAKFIELCEGVFRELGFPPPAMLHEDSLPLAMELEVDQTAFELLHSPNDMASRVLIACRLGEVPPEMGAKGMLTMLKANLTLARAHEAAFGIAPDGNEIRCMYYEDLDQARPSALLEKLRRVAPDACSWRDRFVSAGEKAYAHDTLPSLALP